MTKDKLRERAERAVTALRSPDRSLANVANTVRQSIAEVIEEQQKQIDRYGLVLMMIGEGADNPSQFAKDTLSKYALTASRAQDDGTAAPAPEAGGDLIDRLRSEYKQPMRPITKGRLLIEAATEIERLRASPSAGAEAMREAMKKARQLIGARNDRVSPAVKEADINKAWHILNDAVALPTAPTESQAAQAAADALEAHKIMTPEEYTISNIIGWHQVCRDVDGFGNIGIRYAALPPSGETGEEKS